MSMNCRHRDLRFNIQRNHKKRTTDFAGIKVNVTMTLIIYNNAEENAIGGKKKILPNKDYREDSLMLNFNLFYMGELHCDSYKVK